MFTESNFISYKMSEIKVLVEKYCDLDDYIRSRNREIADLREQRKILEMELSDYMKSVEYSNIGVINSSRDGSTIKIQRPGTWSKPWHISKNDLKFHIHEYFANTRVANPDDCFNWIINHQKEDLVESSNFSYTRIPPGENVEKK